MSVMVFYGSTQAPGIGPPGMGINLNPIKAVKKVGKSVAKGVTTAAKTGVKAGKLVAKTAVKVATLPLAALEKILMQAAIPIARTLCSAPTVVLHPAATSAGVSVNTVSIACIALRTNKMSDFKKHLPALLKIAVQLGATGAFPAIGPVLAAARAIPGAQYVPLLKILVSRPKASRQAPTPQYIPPPQQQPAQYKYTPPFPSTTYQEPAEDTSVYYDPNADQMSGFGTPDRTRNIGMGVLIGGLVVAAGVGVAISLSGRSDD